MLQAFGLALARGDVEALARTLTDDAEFLSDGGGKAAAVPKPVHGPERIAKMLIGFGRLVDWTRTRFKPVSINGLSGWLAHDIDGTPIQTLALQLAADGRIERIYVMRIPDKLRHLQQAAQP